MLVDKTHNMINKRSNNKCSRLMLLIGTFRDFRKLPSCASPNAWENSFRPRNPGRSKLAKFPHQKNPTKKTMSTLHSKTPKKNIPNSTWLPPPPRRTSSHPSGLRSPFKPSRLVSLAQLTSAINGGYHQKEKPQKETFENSKRHRLEGIGVWEVLNAKKAWF